MEFKLGTPPVDQHMMAPFLLFVISCTKVQIRSIQPTMVNTTWYPSLAWSPILSGNATFQDRSRVSICQRPTACCRAVGRSKSIGPGGTGCVNMAKCRHCDVPVAIGKRTPEHRRLGISYSICQPIRCKMAVEAHRHAERNRP